MFGTLDPYSLNRSIIIIVLCIQFVHSMVQYKQWRWQRRRRRGCRLRQRGRHRSRIGFLLFRQRQTRLTSRRPLAAFTSPWRLSRTACTAAATTLPLSAVAVSASILPDTSDAARATVQSPPVTAAVLAATAAWSPGTTRAHPGTVTGEDAQVRALRAARSRVSVWTSSASRS